MKSSTKFNEHWAEDQKSWTTCSFSRSFPKEGCPLERTWRLFFHRLRLVLTKLWIQTCSVQMKASPSLSWVKTKIGYFTFISLQNLTASIGNRDQVDVFSALDENARQNKKKEGPESCENDPYQPVDKATLYRHEIPSSHFFPSSCNSVAKSLVSENKNIHSLHREATMWGTGKGCWRLPCACSCSWLAWAWLASLILFELSV